MTPSRSEPVATIRSPGWFIVTALLAAGGFAWLGVQELVAALGAQPLSTASLVQSTTGLDVDPAASGSSDRELLGAVLSLVVAVALAISAARGRVVVAGSRIRVKDLFGEVVLARSSVQAVWVGAGRRRPPGIELAPGEPGAVRRWWFGIERPRTWVRLPALVDEQRTAEAIGVRTRVYPERRAA